MSELQGRCARELMDTAPQIMQAIRVEMRLGRGADISIPQFRTLRFIQRNPDSSLSSLAENLGLMLPSVSKLVDGLVKADLVIRQESAADRRRLTLDLTMAGEALVDAARENAQARLSTSLNGLCAEELEIIHQAMQLLHPIFVSQAKSSLAKE
jgi:DNA-binding MarR family transcriptional regulator